MENVTNYLSSTYTVYIRYSKQDMIIIIREINTILKINEYLNTTIKSSNDFTFYLYL